MQNQNKKKSLGVKKIPVKKKSNKMSSDQGDSINTTKQRTFATIEQTFQFQDHHKVSTKTTANNTSRRDCIDRMEANKLSPFSSPSKSESPRMRASFSPIVVKQKQMKKGKKSHALDLEIVNKKVKAVGNGNKVMKNRTKSTQRIKAQFENQFLKRMDKVGQFYKKITQLSQQSMEMSICKGNKVGFLAKKQEISKVKKTKNEMIKQMHIKIKQKYAKMYHNLKKEELKLLSAVVLIQRLWRQTKVKHMIGQFLSPRNSNSTFNKQNDKNTNKKQTTSLIQYSDDSEEKSVKNVRQFLSLTPKSLEIKQQVKTPLNKIQTKQRVSVETRVNVDVRVSVEAFNLKDLEISSELSINSLSKAKDIVKYVDHYREVIIKCKKQKKKKRIQKPNAFSFPESLSQKCLLQNLYRKRITSIQNLNRKGGDNQSIQKMSLFFPLKSSEKSKQQYMSPKKAQVVELEQRFYTQVQDEYYQAVSLQKQVLKLQQQTVGSIGGVGSLIVQYLINEFSEQFQQFSTKKCLKKKKRLPGINVNKKTITKYLDSFLDFISRQYPSYFEVAFSKINARSFLKIFRVIPDQEIFESGDEQDQQDLNYPVMPNNAFFQYQPVYEGSEFVIKQDDKKYSNFLSGLIRIHNKCLSDCFNQFIEKQRIESINFPWDQICPVKTDEKMMEGIRLKMPEVVNSIKRKIVLISNTRLGRLYGRDICSEQTSLIQSLRQDYKRQGKQWSEHHDYLEVRLQIVELIVEGLMKQVVQEMCV